MCRVTPRGDRDALVRIAYEAGLDEADDDVVYCEMRSCPHLLCSQETTLPVSGTNPTLVTPRDAVEATLEGLRRAEKERDIKIGLLLSCFRDKPEWSPEVLRLCEEFRDKGVVGIDVSGVFEPRQTATHGEEILDAPIIDAYRKAKEVGIHRTAHAGEAGPGDNVARVIRELGVTRVGHGYSAVIENGDAYQLALREKIHFEVCLSSSYLTGGVRADQEHPVLRLQRDGANYSLSVDDPIITHSRMKNEYELALSLGLSPKDLVETNRAAIEASFLPVDEKAALRQKFDRLNAAV